MLLKWGGQLLGGASVINWYHRDPDDPTYSYSPNPYPAALVDPIPNENTASFNCNSTVVSSGDRVVEFGPIVGDSAEYAEYSEENTYLARTIAYQAMKLDSTIIYQGDSLDADFEAFFERHDSTNIGKFYMVESLIDREPDSAMAILDLISAENNIETYLIEQYQRGQDIAERNYELSAADSAFYLERTVGLPITNGKVYYLGLGTLFIEQHIPIVSARVGQQPLFEQSTLAINNESELIIFPNPTSGLLTIRLSDQKANFSHIEIYNSVGDLIISKEIANNHYLLDMTPYNQGIYFIRALDQSKKYYSKSFNLLK
jgi:Secretion system C-terminal sorting domain